MSIIRIKRTIILGIFCIFGVGVAQIATIETFAQEEPIDNLATNSSESISTQSAVTTSDPTLPIEELELLLKPLTKAELEVEVSAWLGLLQQKVSEVSQAELVVQRKNQELQQTKETVKALDRAQQELEKETEADRDQTSSDTEPSKIEEALEEVEQELNEAAELEAKTETDEELKSVMEDVDRDSEEQTSEDDPDDTDDTVAADIQEELKGVDAEEIDSDQAQTAKDQLETVEEKLESGVAEKKEVKKNVLIELTNLRNEQAALAERCRLVIDKLEKKGGTVDIYRKYVDAVSEIQVDISDTEGFWITATEWFNSEDGGRRWLINTEKSLAIFCGFVFLGWLLANKIYEFIHNRYLVPAVASITRKSDNPMLPVLKTTLKLSIWIIAIVLGLSSAGFEVSTILTGLGIGGFAFALAAQTTISNILGGVTILLQNKIAIGQRIEVDGIKAKVREISLRTTTLVELDYDYEIVVPNQKFINGSVSYIDSRPHYAVYETIHLHHSSSLEKLQLALNLIKEVASQNEYIKGARPSFDKLNEYSFDLKFVYWIKKWQPEEQDIFPNDLWKIYTVKSQMNLEMMRLFETNGLKLALPIKLNQVPETHRMGIFEVSENSNSQLIDANEPSLDE
jgi:small conductance mechanosensitive channel